MWPDIETIVVEVDIDLLQMVAEAENREFASLSQENSDDPCGVSAASPFESGGVSPLSSGPSTPTHINQMSTEDVLLGVNAVLSATSEHSGLKRSRIDDRSEVPPKISRNAKRAAERASFRTTKRREAATNKDVLTEKIADVRPAVEDRYESPRLIQAPYVIAALAIARSGYTGINRPADTTPYDFDNLVNERKFKHVKIDATKP